MKKFLFIFIILTIIHSPGISQVKLQSTEINGKTYWIYPYKFSADRNPYYSSSYESKPGATDYDSEIVPYPQELPDGDYVMYYNSISVYKKKIWFFHRRGEYILDSSRIAALFKLKNNQKTGEAIFFDQNNEVLEKGNYSNNVREGIWLRQSWREITSHVNELGTKYKKYRYTYAGIIESIEYKNGIREGKYKGYVHPDQLRIKLNEVDTSKLTVVSNGNYRLNKISGDWKFYYINGQLATKYTVTDSLGLPIINDYYDKYSYGKKTFHFNGWYEVYFPNGQLLNRKLYQFGRLAQRDTGYYHDGKTAWSYLVKEVKENDSIITNEELFKYDTIGLLATHSSSKNGKNLFEKKYFDGNQLCTESYYNEYYENTKKDSLVVRTIYYDCFLTSNPKRMNEIIYLHPETMITLRKKFDYIYSGYFEQMDDFEFIADTVSNIYYVTEINYEGKNKELEFRTYKHYYRSSYYNFDEKYYSETDSVVLFVNGKRYTGEFKEFAGKWNKKSSKVKMKEDEIKFFSYYYGGRNFSGNPSFGYSSKRLIAYGDYRRRKKNRFHRKLLTSTYGNYSNGFMQGEWMVREKRNGTINEISNYNEGKLHGKQSIYETEKAGRWSDCKKIINRDITKKTGLFRRGRYTLTESFNYENGEYHGTQSEYYCNGSPTSKKEYRNGIPEGIFEIYNEDGLLTKKIHFKNGYYDGKYMEWFSNKKERYNLNFEEGVLVGEYLYNHFNGTPALKGNLINGYKVGEWFTYFGDGNVKYKDIYTIEDSSYLSFTFSNYGSIGIQFPKINDHDLTSCYSNQYYPSGQLAAEGKIKRISRTGVWKFYDEGGNLIRQINYEPGKIYNTDEKGKKDSISHYGYYESWYANGQKQTEAYVLKESTQYDCYQEVSVSMQDLFYINYWDKDNSQTIKNKSGRLKSYHPSTGKLESEGEFMNGKKTGYWRYWDPEGKLTSVGNYVNDVQDGKWLYGDLEGMHFLDDACFDMSDPRVIKDMEMKKKILSINEIFYLNGRIIKEKKFVVDLND